MNPSRPIGLGYIVNCLSRATEASLLTKLAVEAAIRCWASRPVGVWATFQPWIVKAEPSGLQTRIAATESVSIAVRTKGPPLFLTIPLFRSSLGTKVC